MSNYNNLQGVTFNRKILIIIIILIGKANCSALTLHAIEGEAAHLYFPYPCDSHKVTLQYSYRPPFYRSTQPESLRLLPANYNLRVTDQNNTANGKCSLNLTINPVSETDEGAYILTPYKNGVVLPDYPRIDLLVDFLPGKVSCELGSRDTKGEWIGLACTAPVGSLPGQILCYQNGTRLSPLYEPTENDKNLNQIILARQHVVGPVYCCSSALQMIKDRCDCKDWGWDPIQNSVTNIDPCLKALPTEAQTLSPSVPANNVVENSSDETTKVHIHVISTESIFIQENNSNSTVIIAIFLSIFVLTTIILALALAHVCKVKCASQSASQMPPESIPLSNSNVDPPVIQ